jgi:hypothetical protein
MELDCQAVSRSCNPSELVKHFVVLCDLSIVRTCMTACFCCAQDVQEWSKAVATWLHRVCTLYAVACAILMCRVLRHVPCRSVVSLWAAGLSVWQ